MIMKDRFFEWLEANATLYRGTNASDCMESAFMAGVSARDVDIRQLLEAAKMAIEWIEDDRFDDEYISENWYHEMKAALESIGGE